MPAASTEHHAKYGFATPGYTIEMDVAFYDPYAARRLSFTSGLDSTRELCYSSDGQVSSACMDRFVGSVAVVTYHVKTAGGDTPRLVNLCELVTVVSQSSALSARKPFSMTQQLVGGLGSDLQVFGYDVILPQPSHQIRNPAEGPVAMVAKMPAACVYRQKRSPSRSSSGSTR